MPRLQARLIESGFDGMVWQAGKGNPVALNTFLLELDQEGRPRWAWIDLESGVPALAALSPLALFGFYLPRSFRFGRPLFDDVDLNRLRDYLSEGNWPDEVLQSAEELGRRQQRWKTRARVDRSIGRRVKAGLRRIAALRWRRLPSSVARFFLSQGYRAELAQNYAGQRIGAWVERKQMSEPDADVLRTRLEQEDSATFATDFGVHIALKPFVKTFEYWVCPVLYALGFLGEAGLALTILAAGPVARSIYTGGRVIQNSLRGKERPWTALLVGAVPVVGNFAFPIQFLWSSQTEEDELARFLLYDGFARVGAAVPIWGGEDTLTEHRVNRLAEHIVPKR